MSALILLSLLSTAPSVVAETFPYDDIHGWTLQSDLYTESYDNGGTAFMFEVTATTDDGVEYLLGIWPNVQGTLTACQGATRKVGARRWTMLFTDENCDTGAAYPWLR